MTIKRKPQKNNGRIFNHRPCVGGFLFSGREDLPGREQLPREVIALRWLRRLGWKARLDQREKHIQDYQRMSALGLDAPQYWLVFSRCALTRISRGEWDADCRKRHQAW